MVVPHSVEYVDLSQSRQEVKLGRVHRILCRVLYTLQLVLWYVYICNVHAACPQGSGTAQCAAAKRLKLKLRHIQYATHSAGS